MSLGKIILKSTTRISLNDRFTVLRNENPPVSDNGYYNSTAENRQLVQASRKNQRLAAQMERRPAVVAALKPKKQNINNRLNTNQSVSVKQRLALPGRIRLPDTFRGSLRGGSGRGFANIKIRGGISGRGNFQGRIGSDIRGGSSFRGRGRGGRFISRGGGGGGGLGGGQRGRGGQGGRGGVRGRGFIRGRGSRIFR